MLLLLLLLDHTGRRVSVQSDEMIRMARMTRIAALVVLLIHSRVIAHAAPERRRVWAVGHRRGHALLLLPPVAEPDADHFLLQLERVGQGGDLLGRRFRLLVEVLLQGSLDAHLDRRPLLALPSLGRYLVDGRRRAGRRVGLFQPLLQQRLQFAHVLEAELQGLEPADGRLREDVAVQSAQGQSDVGLGESQLDPPLFELFGESFQVVGRRVLLFRRVAAQVASGTRMGPVMPAEVVPSVVVVQVRLVRIVRIVRVDWAAHLALAAHPVVRRRMRMLAVVVVLLLQLALHPSAASAAVHRRVIWMLDRRSAAGRHVRRGD